MSTYVAEKPCVNGHEPLRYIKSKKCVTCIKLKIQRYRERHPKEYNERRKKYRDGLDKKKVAADARKWRKANPDKNKINQTRYRKKNPHKERERNAFNRGRRRFRVSNAERDAMAAYYHFAKYLSRVMGKAYEVDHVHPMRGVNFTGLHRVSNLQILPAELNRRKGNKMEHELVELLMSGDLFDPSLSMVNDVGLIDGELVDDFGLEMEVWYD